MRDELDGRFWTAHHEEFSASLDRLAGKVMEAFRLLNRYQWGAPWEGRAGAGTGPQLLAIAAAILFSSVLVAGAIVPAEVQATARTASAAPGYYLA